MTLGVYFPVKGMTTETHATVHEQLKSIGQSNPAGQAFHAVFHVGSDLHVFDVWESEEALRAFAKHLMPILAEHGIDPGQPQSGDIELMTPTELWPATS